jgi:hypothetical protein
VVGMWLAGLGVSIGTVSNVVDRAQVVAAMRSRLESVIGARLRLRRVRVSTTGRTNPAYSLARPRSRKPFVES